MYYNYAGGVIALNRENFHRINGYSNSYWGWGNEDDDFSARWDKCVLYTWTDLCEWEKGKYLSFVIVMTIKIRRMLINS